MAFPDLVADVCDQIGYYDYPEDNALKSQLKCPDCSWDIDSCNVKRDSKECLLNKYKE